MVMSISGFYNFLYICKDRVVASVSSVIGLISVRIYLPLLVAINALTWITVYYITSRSNEELVVLHYNVDFGVDLMGSVERLYIMPGAGLFVLAVNIVLLLLLHRRRDIRFLAHFLLAPALIVNIILFISLGPIYLVNFVY